MMNSNFRKAKWAKRSTKIKAKFVSAFIKDFIGAEIAPMIERGHQSTLLKKEGWIERASQGEILEGIWGTPIVTGRRPAIDIWRTEYQFANVFFQGPDPERLEEKKQGIPCYYGRKIFEKWEEQLRPFFGSQEMNSLLAKELRKRGFKVTLERGYLSEVSW